MDQFKVKFSKEFSPPLDASILNDFGSMGFAQGAGFEWTSQVESHLSKLFNGKSVCLVDSCTSAMEIFASIYRSRYRRIIVPRFTFITAASSFIRHGWEVVLCDVSVPQMMLEAESLSSLLTNYSPDDTLVMCMHYSGCAIDQGVLDVINNWGGTWIDDAAQMLGCRSENGDHKGLEGLCSMVSFHSTKIVGCGYGGAFISSNHNLVESARILRDRGTNRVAHANRLIDRYTWLEVGSSLSVSEFCSRVLLYRLSYLDSLVEFQTKAWAKWKSLVEHNFIGDFLPSNLVSGNGHFFFVVAASDSASHEIKLWANKVLGVEVVGHYSMLDDTTFGRKYWKKRAVDSVFNISQRLLRFPCHLGLKEIDF